MDRQAFLSEVKSRLRQAHGERLRGVILYGSEARGEAKPDSDIDLLVLLDPPVDWSRDRAATYEALLPLELEIDRPIIALTIDAQQYESYDCPLYREVHRDGIAA